MKALNDGKTIMIRLTFVLSELRGGKTTKAKLLQKSLDLKDDRVIEVSEVVKYLLTIRNRPVSDRKSLQQSKDLSSEIVDFIRNELIRDVVQQNEHESTFQFIVVGIRQPEIFEALFDSTTDEVLWITCAREERMRRFAQTFQSDQATIINQFFEAEQGDINLGINKLKDLIFDL